MVHRAELLGCRHWWTLALLIATVAACAAPANGNWTMRSWQSDEGLPDNSVVGIEQAADGFLWVATRSGLSRFDGVRFREFTALSKAGLPTARLDALYLDRSNRLWVAKDRGAIACVDRGQVTTVLTPKNGLPEQQVRMMAEDSDGNLWISYFADAGVGGDVIRIAGGRVRSFNSRDPVSGRGTCQLATDRSGEIWFAQGSQVGIFRKEESVCLVTNLQAQRIAASRSGGVWIYGLDQQALFQYKEGGKPVMLGRLPLNRASVDVNVIYEDGSGAVWIGTRQNGLFRYDGAAFSKIETAHYQIRSVTEDREGNIWVGTDGGGLNRIQTRSIELVDVGSGIPAEAVRSVCQDVADGLWAVTASGFLSRNKGRGWTNEETLGKLNPIAQCVAADPRGGIWVGTQYRGLFYWRDGVAKNFSTRDGLAAQSVRCLLASPEGELWIGTEWPSALQRFHGGVLQSISLPAGIGSISAMAIDAAGFFWAGTVDGRLFKHERDLLVEVTTKTLAPPESIRSLHATSDGSLWIGYGGSGLGRLKGEEFVQYGTAEGLHDDYISHISVDGRGRLWFAGNRGIFSVGQSEFDGLDTGQRARLNSIVYGSDDGWPSLQASYGVHPGALLTRSGKILIPALTGLACVNVPHLKQNPSQPAVVVTRVVVDGRLVAAYETSEHLLSAGRSGPAGIGGGSVPLHLSPDHQRLEIEFTALNLTAPQNVFFRHRLKGLDRDWVEIGGKREVSYSQIQAGDYSFQLQGCNESGIWSDPPVSFSIRVLPYYWQTWTFRTVATLTGSALIAGSVAWVFRLRHWRRIDQLERQWAMHRERARIAQDLHDDLGSGLTEISFGSEFAQDPTLGPMETRQYAREIGARARELVAALDEIVWAVNPKNDSVASLASYLCQYAERFLKPTRLRLRLDVARELPTSPLTAEERHNLFLACKEALNNIVQHSRATDVTLVIAVEQGSLTVVVGDNGCGLDSTPARGDGDGLGNMQRRLEAIGGNCVLTGVTGSGTEATFKLPLPKTAVSTTR